MVNNIIDQFTGRVRNELFGNIIPFWLNRTRDDKYGGFHGRIKNDLTIEENAPKSLILTARIIWTFSALYRYTRDREYRQMAETAYAYLKKHFYDPEYGGVFWLVDYQGRVINDKKKIYGQAFSIYALAEYFIAVRDHSALEEAINILRLVERHNYDKTNKGYFETSNRNWTISEEMRLSEVDMNEMKSMNTHLHLMEAYTTLYGCWSDPGLKSKLNELVNVFLEFIIDTHTLHFKLFFDERWYVKSNSISFGHDIEGSWLLHEAAEALHDDELLKRVCPVSIQMVRVIMKEGFNRNYGIYAEQNGDGTVFPQVHWWQQAEAIVGLVNAYQLSGDPEYLTWAVKGWEFIESNFVDRKHGEWFYEIDEHGKPDNRRYKVSEWKGPYHNARACIEILKRLSPSQENQ